MLDSDLDINALEAYTYLDTTSLWGINVDTFQVKVQFKSKSLCQMLYLQILHLQIFPVIGQLIGGSVYTSKSRLHRGFSGFRKS